MLEDNAKYETAAAVASVPADDYELRERERTFGFAEGLRGFSKLLDTLERELSQSQQKETEYGTE